MLISGCIVSPNLYHAPDRAGSRCICQKKRCISEPPVVAVQTQGLFESEDSSMVVCNFALPQRSFYGNLMKTGHFSISWSFIDLFVEKLRCHFFASPVKDDSKPQKRRRKVRKFPTHADLDVTVTEPAEKNSCPKPCSRLHHFCCRPRPISPNRDTYFFQQQRNPTVDFVLTGRFGEASSRKSDFSMRKRFQGKKQLP